jgi:hypothetical protein
MRPECPLLLLELKQERALSRREALNVAKFSPRREVGVQVRASRRFTLVILEPRLVGVA